MSEGPDLHYLQRELMERVGADPALMEFLQGGCLDGLWYWNLENPDDEWMSPRFWEVLGVDPATMPHDPAAWRAMIFPEDMAVTVRNFEHHCADPSHPYDQVVRYRHANGSTVWIRCRGIAIRDRTGQPIRLLGAHSDVTRLKQSEDAALRDAALLRSVNEELRQFAYAMSHDMKAPANSIGMILRILLAEHGQTLNEDSRALLGYALSSVARMRVLVEDTLRFTRVVSTDEPARQFDVAAAIGEAVSRCGELIARHDAELRVEAAPTMLFGHRWQITTMVENLIENAILYRDAAIPPRITVTLSENSEPDAPRLALRVRDNGRGVPEPHRGRIFEMFQRLDRHDDIPGTGLGLAICVRIAHRHGGSIRCDAAEDGGSVFTVLLGRVME